MTKLKNKGYIYKVTNIITGQFYIGQRSSYKGLPEDDLGIHYFTSSKIVKPLFMNNTSEWKKEILYRDINYAETLDDMEGYEIHKVIKDKLCLNGYDPTNHGFRTMSGSHRTEETKRKISEGNKGKTSWLKGKHLPEEAKRKLLEANIGKHRSDETKRKISEAKKGKPLSEDTKRKISEGSKGKKCGSPSEETRRKLSEANKGKHLDDATKLKISIAKKGKKHSGN